MSNKKNIIILLAAICLSLLIGYLIAPSVPEGIIAEDAEKKPLFYRNPMNPEITSPTPAKDHMGMDYVPVYEDEDSDDKAPAGTVRIDPVVVQNMGVRTAIAQRKSISRNIRTVGRIEFNEEKVTKLHPKVEGWIAEVFIDKTGEYVKDDDMLLSLYSPMLVTSQQEYLLALKNLKSLKESPFSDIRRGAESLVETSRERLELMDVPEHQILELEENKKVMKNLHIHSPSPGTVVQIGAREGQYVTPRTELYVIVDLATVWVYADIYEYETPWVKLGNEVEMTLSSVPGKMFKGTVSYIFPYAESKTRTTKVRILFDNKEGLLRPNMFSEVVIKSSTLEDVIVIPSEAVVRSGKKERVFIDLGDGKFEPRIVKLGIESNGEVAILEGIKEGEEVVTSSQFLVDSESKLREAVSKMTETGHELNTNNQHPQNSDDDHGEQHDDHQ